jgi:Tol biopolymer transport system component
MTSTRLEGTEGASLPFWSPDSKRIGFFTSTKLKTIAASGGRAEVLCDVSGGRGGAWAPGNTILFAPDAGGTLFKIPATGGSPVAITKLDPARKEVSHRFPTMLPDGEHFLYASLPGKNGRFDIFAGSLKDDSRELIGAMDNAPVYGEPGWLVSSRQGVLSAQAFDARTRKLSGDPVSLGDEPGAILDPAFSFTAGPSASLSQTGALVYFAPPSVNTTPVWVDTTGQVVGRLDVPPGHYSGVMLSPDGRTAALTRATSPSESGIWLADVARGGASPFSTGHGLNSSPVWSPDGTRVVFSSDRDGPFSIYSRSVGDAAPETLLYKSDVQFKNAASWSPDGKWITVTQLDQDTAQNVWILDATGQGELKLHTRGPVRDNAGPFSPDGRWVTYMSEDTGRFEVYAQSFPTPGNKVQVSREGGSIAWWTKDGRTLFFTDDRFASLWSVDVESGPTLRVGQPKKLGDLPPNVIWIDAAPDRKRFLAIVPEHKGQGTLTVVQNWRAAIK